MPNCMLSEWKFGNAIDRKVNLPRLYVSLLGYHDGIPLCLDN